MKKLLYILPLALLTACNPPARLETEQLTAQETVYLTPEHRDSLYLSFEIEYPTSIESGTVLRRVQADLTGRLFGEGYAGKPVREAMQEYIGVARQEYVQNNLAFAHTSAEDSDFPTVLCEEQFLTGRIVYCDDKVMSYNIEQYVYMGGAHGMNSNFYHNFSLQSGNRLGEGDLFEGDWQEGIGVLLRTALVEQSEEFASAEEMQAAGFDLSQVLPNGNFFFSEDGLTWSYTPYEIAPYVFGETEVFLTWDELAHWRKQ